MLSIFLPTDGGLPILTTGSVSSTKLRGYIQVSLRCGLRFCTRGTHDPWLPKRHFQSMRG
jgi:hypothetical protein